ncbi:MAG: hypothetical protein LBV15_01410 [Planctomycetota bacterium]|jgi:hypothetical protein|nr:hypothetical protein [Planctomycetota bacterium]
MKTRLCWLFSALLFALAPAALGGTPGRRLSPQESDAAINSIFNGAQGVTRLEADLVTRKSGGMIKGTQTSYEFLRLETPARMFLQNKGQEQGRLPLERSTLIIADGRNIWEVEARREGAGQRQTGRRSFRPDPARGQGQGLAVFIGLFLMGREVSSAGGLREDFAIDAYEEPLSGPPGSTLHFVLAPRRGGETLELWTIPGQVLPWRVRSFERKEIKFPPPRPGEPPRYKLEETIREIRNVRTNQNGLPPFTAETFLLPLAGDMVVRDEQSNRIMTPEEVLRELEEVRREYRR